MLDTDGIWRTGLVPQAPLQEHAPTILRDDGSNGVYYHMDDLWQLTSALSLRELMDGTNYEPVILVSLGFPGIRWNGRRNVPKCRPSWRNGKPCCISLPTI